MEKDAILLNEWYGNNYLKPNPDKWDLLLSNIGNEHCVKIGQIFISNSANENILGVFFDNNVIDRRPLFIKIYIRISDFIFTL